MINLITLAANADMNLWEMTMKGGWIMIVLAILSLAGFYILFERNSVIRKAGKEDPLFMERIKDYIKSGEIRAAIDFCRHQNTPSARMIEKGISRLGQPADEVRVTVENVGNLEVSKLERGLPILATVAGGAPMIGFLGTVTGMVRSFWNISNMAAGNIDLKLLSGGIYEALITTVGGLIVGLIALFSYNYLVSLLTNVVNKMEGSTLSFLDILNELNTTEKQ